MKMKVKRMLALSLSLIMVFLIAACAPKPKKEEKKDSKKVEDKADEKKADEKKDDEKKADEKKADEKKADEKKADEKKDDEKKDDEKKDDEKKADEKKSDEKKDDEKKADEKKADEKKDDEKKADEKKDDEKKADEKKDDEKKADEKKDDKEESADAKEYHIDVILKTTASEYWGYVEAGALSYMKDHPNVTVTVKGAPSETSYDDQLNLIETDLSSDEFDGYVISPLQADMVENLIKDSNKPIIAVDTRIESDKVLAFVGTGNLEASKLGGAAAVEAAKEAGWKEIKAIAISGVQGDSTATDRLTGYQAGIEEAGGEFLADEVQYADAVADRAVTSMEAIIQKYPEGIAIIVCNNDDMAIGAARAAKDVDAYENTVFVGFDGNISAAEAIMAGEETLSVAQDAFGMGYMSVEAVVKVLEGETVDEFIDSGAKIIDKSNAEARKAELEGFLGK